MSRRSLAAALTFPAAAAALVACVACGSGAAANRKSEPASHTVVLEGMKYTPATVTIHPGDSVTWINKDVVAHTATAPATDTAAAAASSQQPFDSGTIEPGKSWTRTFTAAGRVSYICSLHPTMQAVVEIAK